MEKKKAVKKEDKNRKSVVNIKNKAIEQGKLLFPIIKNNKMSELLPESLLLH